MQNLSAALERNGSTAPPMFKPDQAKMYQPAPIEQASAFPA
jgi:hypothetical protein